MTSACDIAFRGNPGNYFPSILRNLVFERPPLHARHVCFFLIHYLCLDVSIKKEPGIVLSLLPIVPPPTFTRAAIFNQFLSRPSAFWMRLNTAMIFSFLFWFFDIYVPCHLFHHPQPSSTTSLLAESKYVFTLTISLSHCRVSKFKHWSSNIHFYFW